MMRDRRHFLSSAAACVVAVAFGKVTRPRRPTVKQLIAAARRWLKRHHVRRWATVTIIPGDGPPQPALLTSQTAGDWRWSPLLYSWVSPAFQVSWSAGDVIPSFESPFAGQHVQLYVGDWTVGGDPALSDPVTLAASSDFGLMESYGDFLASDEQTAASSGSGVAFVIQSQAVPQPDAVNLIHNGSFEQDLAGWGMITAGTLTRDNAEALYGTWSAKVVNNTEGFAYLALGGTTGWDRVPVSPGDVISIAASAKGDNGSASIGVNWYSSGGSSLGQAGFSSTAQGSMDGSWKTLKAEGLTAPANAAWYSIRLGSNDPGTGIVTWWDGVIAVKGSTVPAFFDGDSAFDGDYSYQWRRDPYESASVRLPHVTTPIPADPTEPLDATLIVQSLIGDDVTVGDTFAYPSGDVAGVGDDGQWYVDTSGKALYGPKDDGVWPDDPVILSA